MTDWWIFGATIAGSVITLLGTVLAIRNTEKNLRNEEIRKFKNDNYVILEPSLRLITFTQFLDQIIAQNNYNRVLLFSGTDGFDFLDDSNKKNTQFCRILLIENKSNNAVENIEIKTLTIMKNLNTNEQVKYETINGLKNLKPNESIIIRILNQEQYEKIIHMNNNKISSCVDFKCDINYSTLAKERIEYKYEINIMNDKNVQVLSDGIEKRYDIKDINNIEFTTYKNLQDYLQQIDRANYIWQKMSEAQMGIFQKYFGLFNMQNKEKEVKEKEINDLNN